jgi:hypothetical protein
MFPTSSAAEQSLESELMTLVDGFLESGIGALTNEPGVSVGMGGGAVKGGGGTLNLGKFLELAVADGNDSLCCCCCG